MAESPAGPVEPSRRIVYCRCAYSAQVPPEVKDAVLRGLAESGAPFDAAADLCELAARRDPMLRRIAEMGNVRIAACYERAVRWLFAWAGAELPQRAIVCNMKVQPAGEIVRALVEGVAPAGGRP